MSYSRKYRRKRNRFHSRNYVMTSKVSRGCILTCTKRECFEKFFIYVGLLSVLGKVQ